MQDEATVTCPHCWEEISLSVDPSLPDQTYIEDCPVCCHAMRVTVRNEDGELLEIQVERADG